MNIIYKCGITLGGQFTVIPLLRRKGAAAWNNIVQYISSYINVVPFCISFLPRNKIQSWKEEVGEPVRHLLLRARWMVLFLFLLWLVLIFFIFFDVLVLNLGTLPVQLPSALPFLLCFTSRKIGPPPWHQSPFFRMMLSGAVADQMATACMPVCMPRTTHCAAAAEFSCIFLPCSCEYNHLIGC